jgi:hypothetical protein
MQQRSTGKTGPDVLKAMEAVRKAKSESKKAYKQAKSTHGYYNMHALSRLFGFDPALHYLNDFMHKIYNIVKLIFQYIGHEHFKEGRKKAFMKEDRRFSDNSLDNHVHDPPADHKKIEWINTNEYMETVSLHQ